MVKHFIGYGRSVKNVGVFEGQQTSISFEE